MSRETTSSQKFNESPERSDFELMDVENYRSDKMIVFNHQMLVMEALRKSSEAGSHELRSGWVNEKMDTDGNITRTPLEDTRKKFIECVRTTMTVMECDFDERARTNIQECMDELDKIKEDLLKGQWNWYLALAPKYQMQYSGNINEKFFNINLGWYLKYIEEEVLYYREILVELHSLTKRLDFYQIEDFEV